MEDCNKCVLFQAVNKLTESSVSNLSLYQAEDYTDYPNEYVFLFEITQLLRH